MSSQQHHIAHDFCAAFLFYKRFPEEVTITLLTINVWMVVGPLLSYVHPGEGEEVLKHKGRLKEKALNDHIVKFSISRLSWSLTPDVFICWEGS